MRHIIFVKLCLILPFFAILPVGASSQQFFDDFSGERLNNRVWKKADRKWGEQRDKRTHGGVVSENIFLRNGNLVIKANGDLYDGNTVGHGQNTRVGGAVSSRNRFSSGRFEIRAKICPQIGVLSAFWTYRYKSASVNHEIDFEFPGKNSLNESDLEWALLSNWRGIDAKQHQTESRILGAQVDGDYHLYRFDWHRGTNSKQARIEWYFDNRLMYTSYEHVPSRRSNLWLGLWFPSWLGPANFGSDYMYIDWVRITPLK